MTAEKMRLCWILSAAVILVSAHNKTSCLKYLDKCSQDKANCCDYPMISCLPDKNNGTSCLSMYDLVNLNPLLTGMAAFQPLLLNSTGFIAESIDVNGKNVYNTTEAFTPKPKGTAKPTSMTTILAKSTSKQTPKLSTTIAPKPEQNK